MSKLNVPELPGVVKVMKFLANAWIFGALLIIAGFIKAKPEIYNLLGPETAALRQWVYYVVEFVFYVGLSCAAAVTLITRLTKEQKEVVKEATEHERVRKSNVYRKDKTGPFSREPNRDVRNS